MPSLRHWSKKGLWLALTRWQRFLFYQNKPHKDRFFLKCASSFLREHKNRYLNRKKRGRIIRKARSFFLWKKISVTRFKYLKILNVLPDWNSLLKKNVIRGNCWKPMLNGNIKKWKLWFLLASKKKNVA